ncbi:hypothetical protein ACQPZJ_26210 [Actinoplanes sp. CA-054009]
MTFVFNWSVDQAAYREIESRVQYFLETSDARAVLGADAGPAARILRRAWHGQKADEHDEQFVALLYLVAWWHWCRYLEVPAEHEEVELHTALNLFGFYYSRDPRSVPFLVYRMWHERDPSGVLLQDPDDLNRRGVHHLELYATHNQPADLDSAADLFASAAAQVSADHPARAMYTGNLATALRLKFEHTGEDDDLRPWLSQQRDAVALTAPHNRNAVHRLRELIYGLTQLNQREPEPAVLDEAIGHARRWALLGAWYGQDAEEPTLLAELIHERCLAAYNGDLVDEGIEVLRRFLAREGPASTAGRANAHARLSALLQLRFDRTGDPNDMDEAVANGEIAVAVDDTDPALGGYLSTLGNVLRLRHELRGAAEDIERATEALRRAVARGTGDQDHDAIIQSNLGNVLHSRFRAHGRTADLDDAVLACRTAIDLSSPRRRPHLLATLAMVLRERFEQAGHRGDLEDAITAAGEAAGGALPDDLYYAMYLSELGVALFRRYGLSSATEDFEASVDAQRRAIEATGPDDSFRSNRLGHLALCYLARYQREHAVGDLTTAIVTMRAALESLPVETVNSHLIRSHLAAALLWRATDRPEGADADLDEAVRLSGEAYQHCPPGYVHRAALAVLHSRALLRRHRRRGEPAGLATATTVLHEAADSPGATVGDRITAALWHAALVADDGAWTQATDSFGLALRLLPLAAWRGAHRSHQERHLAEANEAPSMAAATSLELGDGSQAVERLELGRAVLWSQMLELRADYSALHAVAPDVAQRMDEIRLLLDGSGDETAVPPSPYP